jgi:hypothetical protein
VLLLHLQYVRLYSVSVAEQDGGPALLEAGRCRLRLLEWILPVEAVMFSRDCAQSRRAPSRGASPESSRLSSSAHEPALFSNRGWQFGYESVEVKLRLDNSFWYLGSKRHQNLLRGSFG